MRKHNRSSRSYVKPAPVYKRLPLVYNAKGYPFIWHDLERDRIEIRHGEKLTVLQLQRGTPVFRTPWRKEYRSLPEYSILDLDNQPVATWIAGALDMEIDLFVIRHSRQITCFSIPKHTLFQVQHETVRRAA